MSFDVLNKSKIDRKMLIQRMKGIDFFDSYKEKFANELKHSSEEALYRSYENDVVKFGTELSNTIGKLWHRQVVRELTRPTVLLDLISKEYGEKT